MIGSSAMREPLPQRDEDGEGPPEPPALRRLRRLVTALVGVMILATLTVAGALVWKLTRAPDFVTDLTARIETGGGRVVSASRTDDALILLIEDARGRSLIFFDPGDGRPLGRYALVPESVEAAAEDDGAPDAERY